VKATAASSNGRTTTTTASTDVSLSTSSKPARTPRAPAGRTATSSSGTLTGSTPGYTFNPIDLNRLAPGGKLVANWNGHTTEAGAGLNRLTRSEMTAAEPTLPHLRHYRRRLLRLSQRQHLAAGP
jgi:hypothetical protein